MVSSSLLCICIIFLHLINFITTQTPSCPSLYVTIEIISGSLDINNWNGVYTIDTNMRSFNRTIWKIPNSNKWLKYIETHWVLSGDNDELLIYESNILFPPVNQSTIWTHEFDTDPIQLRLDCSSTYSPTTSPTPAPTTLPTYSPTISDCNILVVSDSSGSNTINTTYFTNWKYYRLSTTDYNNRPIWQYINDDTESYVQYLNTNGWVVFLNDGTTITTYATNKLFGNFPPLNQQILFNITTNKGLIRIFTFICLATDIPTISPSNMPNMFPTSDPTTNTPTYSPNNIYPYPTTSPTNSPTIAPSMQCQVLKINVERTLIINNNPNCDIDFDVIFKSYWLKQISKSNRPSWTLDCDDQNNEYTTACDAGYSGSVFFISNQWEIQIHSKNDDCFERFIVDNTNSFFIPTNKQWTDVSTMKTYLFSIQCTDRMYAPTPALTADTFITKQQVYIYDEVWFWIAFLLILLICIALCIGAYYYNKQRKPIVIYEPKQVKSISHMNVSRQKLELQNTPQQAYIDDDIAPEEPIHTTKRSIDERENKYKSNHVTDGDPHVTGSTVNPNLKNPNIKKNYVGNINNLSQKNLGEELKENISVSDNENSEELYDNNDKNKETPVETDKALNMIAGNKKVTGYNANEDDIITKDEDVDQIFSV